MTSTNLQYQTFWCFFKNIHFSFPQWVDYWVVIRGYWMLFYSCRDVSDRNNVSTNHLMDCLYSTSLPFPCRENVLTIFSLEGVGREWLNSGSINVNNYYVQISWIFFDNKVSSIYSHIFILPFISIFLLSLVFHLFIYLFIPWFIHPFIFPSQFVHQFLIISFSILMCPQIYIYSTYWS